MKKMKKILKILLMVMLVLTGINNITFKVNANHTNIIRYDSKLSSYDESSNIYNAVFVIPSGSYGNIRLDFSSIISLIKENGAINPGEAYNVKCKVINLSGYVYSANAININPSADINKTSNRNLNCQAVYNGLFNLSETEANSLKYPGNYILQIDYKLKETGKYNDENGDLKSNAYYLYLCDYYNTSSLNQISDKNILRELLDYDVDYQNVSIDADIREQVINELTNDGYYEADADDSIDYQVKYNEKFINLAKEKMEVIYPSLTDSLIDIPSDGYVNNYFKIIDLESDLKVAEYQYQYYYDNCLLLNFDSELEQVNISDLDNTYSLNKMINNESGIYTNALDYVKNNLNYLGNKREAYFNLQFALSDTNTYNSSLNYNFAFDGYIELMETNKINSLNYTVEINYLNSDNQKICESYFNNDDYFKAIDERYDLNSLVFKDIEGYTFNGKVSGDPLSGYFGNIEDGIITINVYYEKDEEVKKDDISCNGNIENIIMNYKENVSSKLLVHQSQSEITKENAKENAINKEIKDEKINSSKNQDMNVNKKSDETDEKKKASMLFVLDTDAADVNFITGIIVLSGACVVIAITLLLKIRKNK